MRYDTLMTSLDRARARYESEVSLLLRNAVQQEDTTKVALLKTTRKTYTHWMQRPENRVKMRKAVRKMQAARRHA